VIKITFEFADYVEAGKAIALLSGGLVVASKPGASDVPNQTKAAAAGKPAAEKQAPAPAPAASSPAPTPSAAPAGDDPKPEDLTKAVVAAVGRAGRDKVIAHLKDVYGVSKGVEITDVPTRIKAIASVSAL